ncbi:hypothetical protein NQ317_001880, partial [Molorchus minor]
QGHIVLKPKCDPSSEGYYIPHHGVSKVSSSTPLRIVFDAGMKTDRNVSLNDVLFTGEKLQGDLFIMLINFRLFRYAFTTVVQPVENPLFLLIQRCSTWIRLLNSTSYWKRWHLEYLSGLQSRQKWNTPSFPVKVGLLVIICRDNVPPLQWPVGIIEEVFPGKDGTVRVVRVRTRDGVYNRPATKVCPLPSQ